MKIYKALIWGVCCYGMFLISVNAQSIDNSFWYNIEKIRFDNPDSAILVLNDYYDSFIEQKDTVTDSTFDFRQGWEW